jgi:hypothetical protein
MKLRYVAPLAIAASAAAIGLAPIAAADATVHQSQGNAQITATPGAAALGRGPSDPAVRAMGLGRRASRDADEDRRSTGHRAREGAGTDLPAEPERPSFYGKARLQDGQFLCQDPKCPKYRSHGALAVGLAG